MDIVEKSRKMLLSIKHDEEKKEKIAPEIVVELCKEIEYLRNIVSNVRVSLTSEQKEAHFYLAYGK